MELAGAKKKMKQTFDIQRIQAASGTFLMEARQYRARTNKIHRHSRAREFTRIIYVS